MFGKNTDEDRAKLKEELEDVHVLFKGWLPSNGRVSISNVSRPVSTGTELMRWNLV